MILTLDFETYYDKEYSLKRLTTEEYVRDNARFKVHGVGLKSGDQPSAYIWSELPLALKSIDWSSAYVLCHNTRFDGAILSWRYGIRPKFLLDTMSMARAVFPHESSSLANLSKLCGLGEKGHDLENFMGKRDLTEEEQVRLGAYCMNDVDLTYALFNHMKAKFAPSELRIIDQTLRMFTEPVLELDEKVLFDHLQKIQVKQEKLLDGRGLTSLRSNPQFAKLLEGLGVVPPVKTSLRTGKETFAFAKTDEGMLSLLEHENEEVALLAAARLGVKSSIEETRTKAFLGISERGAMPVPLNYFGAQNTGRFSGADGLNLQNLPRGGELRNAIVAPAGHVLVVSDFAQIEARMIAWLAGQEELLEQFRQGDDVYCRFASKIYGRVITKEDKRERFLGKVCILALGYSLGWRKLATILATGPMGQAPILFTADDLNTMDGRMEELDTAGITTKLTGQALSVHCAASKHLVDTYRNSYDRIPNFWRTCDRMLSSMAGGTKHQYGCLSSEKDAILMPNGLKLQYKDLWKDEEGSWRYTGKRGEKQYIYGGKLAENCLAHGTQVVVYSGTKPIEAVTTDDLVWDGVEWVRHGGIARNGIQEVGEWQGIHLTGNHLIHDGDSWKPVMDLDENASWRSLVLGRSLAPGWLLLGNGADTAAFFSGVPVGMNTEQNDELSGAKTRQLLAPSARGHRRGKNEGHQKIQSLSAHFDLLGPTGTRGWFHGATTRIIERIRTMVGGAYEFTRSGWKTGTNSFSTRCRFLVGAISDWIWIGPTMMETTNREICGCVIGREIVGTAGTPVWLSTKERPTHTPTSTNSFAPIGQPTLRDGTSTTEKPANGLWTATGEPEEVFDILNCGPRNRFMVVTPNGPVIVHNCVQALSRIVLTDAMLAVGSRYKIVLTVHDEIVCCVPERDADEVADFISAVMSEAPDWCADLPVACEVSVARSYGEAK